VHRKVWLWWGKWWAVQVQLPVTLAVGMRVELRRPLFDLYVGSVTVSVGRHAVITDESVRHADSCRGFLFADSEVL
jgi:hypothetical protein